MALPEGEHPLDHLLKHLSKQDKDAAAARDREAEKQAEQRAANFKRSQEDIAWVKDGVVMKSFIEAAQKMSRRWKDVNLNITHPSTNPRR